MRICKSSYRSTPATIVRPIDVILQIRPPRNAAVVGLKQANGGSKKAYVAASKASSCIPRDPITILCRTSVYLEEDTSENPNYTDHHPNSRHDSYSSCDNERWKRFVENNRNSCICKSEREGCSEDPGRKR